MRCAINFTYLSIYIAQTCNYMNHHSCTHTQTHKHLLMVSIDPIQSEAGRELEPEPEPVPGPKLSANCRSVSLDLRIKLQRNSFCSCNQCANYVLANRLTHRCGCLRLLVWGADGGSGNWRRRQSKGRFDVLRQSENSAWPPFKSLTNLPRDDAEETVGVEGGREDYWQSLSRLLE